MARKLELAANILSDIIVFMKYAKYLPEKNRRETWSEIVDRNKEMHLKRYPALKEEIEQAYAFVYDRRVLPSARSLQFAGKPIEISNNRMYNCAFIAMDAWEAFHELMFLLLGGSGVGYSVQTHHIEKLPPIIRPTKTRRYLIQDSLVGWADAVKVLMKAYFTGRASPLFDFSDIRPKGSPLKTAGGKAPGPEPLKDCLHNIQKILDRKESGEHLTSLEVHDINCFIADAVMSGGIRRAAMLALFDIDDEDMLSCKFGTWYEENPQRGRANNSAHVLRHKIDEPVFRELWDKIKASGTGEPGIVFGNDREVGVNPCGEASLRAGQFCNLTSINTSDITSQEEFNARARAAAFIGTLQAGYTNFHYLRDLWKKTTEKDALLGVGLSGIASGSIFDFDIEEAAKTVVEENARVAKLIGINKAARCNVVKPDGTVSLVLGTSSGVHAWHSEYFVRRVRVNKNENIYYYLQINHPELLEDDYFVPTKTSIITIPQKAPEGAILRTEPAIDLLNRVKTLYNKWIVPGHRKGANKHSVSCTVTIKPDEWKKVGDWMWNHREEFTTISVLPYSDHTYKQPPFEEISRTKYYQMLKPLVEVDLTKVIEVDDETARQNELACAGGACEI